MTGSCLSLSLIWHAAVGNGCIPAPFALQPSDSLVLGSPDNDLRWLAHNFVQSLMAQLSFASWDKLGAQRPGHYVALSWQTQTQGSPQLQDISMLRFLRDSRVRTLVQFIQMRS